MNLPQLPQDKANHFIYGFVIFILANLILNEYLSLLVVIISGLAKELIDEYDYYKGFSWLDLLATVTPAAILTLNK